MNHRVNIYFYCYTSMTMDEMKQICVQRSLQFLYIKQLVVRRTCLGNPFLIGAEGHFPYPCVNTLKGTIMFNCEYASIAS